MKSPSCKLPVSTKDVPWVVVFNGENQTFYSTATLDRNCKQTHVYRRCRIAEFLPKCSQIIQHSPFGWLVLGRVKSGRTAMNLVNSATQKVIKLPKLADEGFNTVVLTLPPTHPDCKVIAAHGKVPKLAYCKPAASKGNNGWTVQTFRGVKNFFHSLAVWQGIVYAITDENTLFAINEDLTGSKNKLVVSRVLTGSWPLLNTWAWELRLVESAGELFQFCIRTTREDDLEFVQVLKLTKSESSLSSSSYSWVQVKSLEGRAIFASDLSAFSCSPLPGQKGPKPNCVYFFQHRYQITAFDVTTGQSSCFMLAPAEVDLYHDSPTFSMAFLSYDRGQATTTPHCTSGGEEVCPSTKNVDTKKVIGNNEEDETISSSNTILDLPLDILQHITRRLVVVGEYRNLHCSCKAFKSIAPLITSGDDHGDLVLQSPSSYPWFFFLRRHMGNLHLHDLRCRNTFTNKHLQLPTSSSAHDDTRIFFSKERWLLVCKVHNISDPDLDPDYEYQFTFWNPLTKEVRTIPGMMCPPLPISIGVSAAPTSPHCSIMGVVSNTITKAGGVYFFFIKLDGGHWQYTLDEQLNFQPRDHNISVFMEDKFYFLDKKRKLGVFSCQQSVEGYEWERHVYPWKLLSNNVDTVMVDPHYDCKSETAYLVICGGKILSILVGELGRSILIYRFDQEKKGWWKVKTLGSYMVFVSHTSCFSIKTTIPEMRNKIYFPRVSAKGSIVFYSLDTHKYHTFDCDENPMDDFQPTSEVHLCGWIEPNPET